MKGEGEKAFSELSTTELPWRPSEITAANPPLTHSLPARTDHKDRVHPAEKSYDTAHHECLAGHAHSRQTPETRTLDALITRALSCAPF